MTITRLFTWAAFALSARAEHRLNAAIRSQENARAHEDQSDAEGCPEGAWRVGFNHFGDVL